MSKTEILYVKGMNISESDRDDQENAEDIWDDTKLNEAYDKALRMANAEVAKRVAMSTNTLSQNETDKNTVSKSPPAKLNKKGQRSQWKAGMPCRAVYEGDDHEYEAFLLRIINDKECVVRFLGYENSEIVPISSLKPTLGKTERTRQMEDALVDKTDDCGSSSTFHVEETLDHSDREPSAESSGIYTRTKRSGKKKRQKPKQFNGFNLPDMPMPNISQLRNLDLDMPMPPPPMVGGAGGAEEQAVSAMLLSWYMSGYYTGLYHGMKRAKENQRH